MSRRMLVPLSALVIVAGAAAAHAARCDAPAEQAAVQATSRAIQAQCDCAGAATARDYRRCARAVVDARFAAGQLPKACRKAANRCARASTCGRPGTATCCRTSASGKQSCRVVRRAAHCTPRRGGTATVGACASCCEACGQGTCEAAIRCCVPDSPGGAFPDGAARCEELTAAQCEALGGASLGAGTCEPDACAVAGTTTTIAPATTSTTAAPATTTTTTPPVSTTTTTTTPSACGNGTIDPGETCDPPGALHCPDPGSPSGSFVACLATCTCPGDGATTTTTVATPATTTTTLPGLGSRTFTLRNAADPEGSHLYSSLLNGADVAKANTFTGAFTLVGGSPGSDGVATLRLGGDAFVGAQAADNSYICFKLEAVGSSGRIDCDGGLPVGVALSVDSNGTNPPSPAVLALEQGPAGAPGAGYVQLTVRGANCPGDASGACTGLFLSPADCADPSKVNYGVAQAGTTAFTTGTMTVTITEPRQGGGPLTVSKTGQPFACNVWSTDGPGIVELGVPAFDTAFGDAANVAQFDD
ncbi:MAG: hypothetical protein KIT14_07245 [bacterium]|nr:hypothetical protein [bacterium]